MLTYTRVFNNIDQKTLQSNNTKYCKLIRIQLIIKTPNGLIVLEILATENQTLFIQWNILTQS